MRTLKKTLSLVLVVAMVLGLCVVGASAYNKVEDFTDDVSKIGTAYYEAVGVLTGIGVIDGMTETAFEPQGNYTREQAAKIIAYMQLGKDKADSLKCTVAPFEDVAATRWSAGYIAYCVEQGIIDGMTETTFEPTGKLTGFQWAKMLLCAVGFGVNGEFTGSSWSVNTAKVAHTVDLFKGDLAGADHTAITREQAALYAFNVLTNVKKVAYSPNVTNYVFGIGGYEVVGGIGSTLGQDVFGLVPYTGIITANEGTGASYTTLSTNYKNGNVVAKIDADTGIDMMYHAARIWAVNGVSVFVCDLAKTTVASCYSIPAAVAANASKVGANSFSIGKISDKPYEYALVDNSAYNKSYAGVTFYYDMGILGVTDAARKTTVIDGTTVSSSKIWSDISGIAKFSTVIYLVEGGVYTVKTVSATSGTISDYDNATGTITLTDGTKLAKSIFYAGTDITDASKAKLIVGNTYSFALDSHGHFYAITRAGIANLYYYTGEWQITSNFNSYHGEHTYTAQFYNVTTGEPVDLTVLSSFIFTHDNRGAVTGLRDAGFYDLGVADASGVYYPGADKNTGFEKGVAVDKTYNMYAGKYAVSDGLKLTATTTYVPVNYGDGTKNVYFDKNVKFIIASGTGTKVTTTTYNSLSELIGAYTGNQVKLKLAALTLSKSSTDNYTCSVVFGYVGSVISSGVNLFLPKNLTASDWKLNSNGVYYYNGFYLNGSPITVYKTGTFSADMTRGFYTYKIENTAKGENWTTVLVDNSGKYNSYTGTTAITSSTDGRVWLNNRLVADNPVVVDCTSYANTDYAINTIEKLVSAYDSKSVYLAYTWTAAGVNVIYVLETGWENTITVTLSDALKAAGWSLDKSTFAYDASNQSVTVTLVNKNEKLGIVSGANYPVTVTDAKNETADNLSAAYSAGNKLSVTFTYADTDLDARHNGTFTIDGLKLDITIASSVNGVYVQAPTATKTIVLGESMTAVLKDTRSEKFTNDVTAVFTESNNYQSVSIEAPAANTNVASFSFYPLIWGTYNVTAFNYSWTVGA